MKRADSLLSEEDRALLAKTNELLENLQETLEILGNPTTAKQLRESEADVKAGRVRPYSELRKELVKAGKLQPRDD